MRYYDSPTGSGGAHKSRTKKYLCQIPQTQFAHGLPSVAPLRGDLCRPQPCSLAPGRTGKSILNITVALCPDHTFLFQRVIPDTHNSCSVNFLFSTSFCQQFSRDRPWCISWLSSSEFCDSSTVQRCHAPIPDKAPDLTMSLMVERKDGTFPC